MPAPPFREVTSRLVDYNDLENFLCSALGVNVEIIWEATGVLYKITVNGRFPMDDREYNFLITRNIQTNSWTLEPTVSFESMYLRSLMNRLYNEGKLEAGNYLIDVHW